MRLAQWPPPRSSDKRSTCPATFLELVDYSPEIILGFADFQRFDDDLAYRPRV